MAPITPMPPVRPHSSSRKRPLSEDDQARRVAVERLHVSIRPRISSRPVAPIVAAVPQNSLRRRPLLKDDEARRAAVERQYVSIRPRTQYLGGQRREEQNGSISLPITKLGLNSTEATVRTEGSKEAAAKTKTAQGAVEPWLPVDQSHRATNQSEIRVPCRAPIGDYADAAVQTPSQGASQLLPAHKQNHQSKARLQAKQSRDIYQFPKDPINNEPAFEEPKTSSFRFPIDESPVDEPETCSFHYSSRPSVSTMEDSQRDFLEPDSGSGEKDEPISVGVSKPNNKSLSDINVYNNQDTVNCEGLDEGQEAFTAGSEGEQLNDEERKLLGEYSDDDEPLFAPATSSRSPERQLEGKLSQISQSNYQVDDVYGSNNDCQGGDIEEDVSPAPSKRRRGGRQISRNVAHDIFKSLIERRKLKAKSTSRASRGTPSVTQKPGRGKRPRRLQVNELITVSERFEDSDSGANDSESGRSKSHATKQRPLGKRYKGIGLIDVGQFRLPDVRDFSSARSSFQCTSYRDGFEGREAEPTGWTMPVKCSSYKRETPQRVMVDWGKLTLVKEKPSSVSTRKGGRQRKRKPHSTVEPHSYPHYSIDQDIDLQVPEQHESHPANKDGDNQKHKQSSAIQEVVLGNRATDGSEPQSTETTRPENSMARPQAGLNHPHRSQVHQGTMPEQQGNVQISANTHNSSLLPLTLVEPLTPQIISGDEENYEHGAGTTSPSQRKLQSKHHGAQISRPNELAHMPPETTNIARKLENSSLPHSQRSTASSNPNKTPKQIKADLEAMLELSMVSVRRRSPDEEEDNSEDGRNSDEDRNDEESSNSGESCGDKEGDEASSDMELEQDYYQEDLRLPADVQQPAQNEDDNQQKHGSNLPKQFDIQGSPLNTHVVTSTQEIAKKALKMEDISQELGDAIDNDMPALLQDDMRNRSPPLRSKYNEYQDSSWRPRVPSSSGRMMEVDEDIEDSPTPVIRRASQATRRVSVSRHRSQLSSQPLHIVRASPMSPKSFKTQETQYDTQESIILGETQNFVVSEREIPETQHEEEPRFQVQDEPSYFTQASQALKDPTKFPAVRAKSSPERPRLGIDKDTMNILPPSAMFRSTLTPSKSCHQPTLIQDTLTSGKSLSALTRRASQGMGTIPGRPRTRIVSMSFKPPFKNLSRDSGRIWA